MHEEMESLQKNETWELVNSFGGITLVGCKIFKKITHRAFDGRTPKGQYIRVYQVQSSIGNI